MDTPAMRFLNAEDYYTALVRGIPKATSRIVIHAMNVQWGPRCDVLARLLSEASKRGVPVQVVGDAYSRFQARMPRLNRAKGTNWHHSVTVNDRLRKDGVAITYIGKLGFNPFAGRTHSKVTLLDDHIFTFGGVNFTDDSFDNTDYMLEMHDPILADRLERLVKRIAGDQSVLPDLEEQVGGSATLLFDGGTPKTSVIYDTACRIVSQAKKIYYVSQMCPSGRLAKLIKAVDYECYFIRPGQADVPSNLALIADKHRYHIKNSYHGEQYIHAKFILTEDKNGTRHLVSGSNNFSWRGIAYGTKEIAVHSTDGQLWQDFYNFLDSQIRQ